MREFDLASVDWDTVRLMQAGQFKQETFYLEELVRWTLNRGRIAGLLHLEDDGISNPSPEGEQMYSLSVRGCFAVAEAGNIIEIPDDPSLALRGTIEARTPTVPLFIGVSLVERAREPELYPSIDTGLLQCGGRRRQYLLSADDSDEGVDWLQIAQFTKMPTGLITDPVFLPECMYLCSCAGLWNAQREIKALASEAMDTLEKHSADAVPVFAAAIALAGSLGPAARLIDGRLHPRAYMDRLAGVLAAQRTQLRALPKPNLAHYQDTLDQLDRTLAYFESEWTLGQAFVLVRECFDRLVDLYPPLLESLNKVAPPQRVVESSYETVLAAQPNPRTTSEVQNTPKEQRPKGSIWRK